MTSTNMNNTIYNSNAIGCLAKPLQECCDVSMDKKLGDRFGDLYNELQVNSELISLLYDKLNPVLLFLPTCGDCGESKEPKEPETSQYEKVVIEFKSQLEKNNDKLRYILDSLRL